MTGYLNKIYAYSLAEFGNPVFLENSKAWILERDIPNSKYKDAMGCYPLFACENWEALEEDLKHQGNDNITFSMVTDPFGDFSETGLKKIFSDRCIPFKTHYVLSLQDEWQKNVNKNHLRKVRKASNKLDIFHIQEPLNYLDEWNRLYAILIDRHKINGISRFSRQAFEKQFKTDGIHIYAASVEGRTVGMVLYYEMDDVVFYHLGAYDFEGYEYGASFGIFWQAINDFAHAGKKWLNLGSGAGILQKEEDGLIRFKKGWTSETRTSYLCGKVFNKKVYDELTTNAGFSSNGFFPAYRDSL